MRFLKFKKNIFKTLIINFLLISTLLEIFLRAFKSIYYDGILWIHTPSVNNIFDKKLGWISPKNRSFYKKDKLFGNGEITYNSQGFRAPEYIDENKWVKIRGFENAEVAHKLCLESWNRYIKSKMKGLF